MTVQELINWLEKVEDKTRLVILRKDAAGNGYSPVAGVAEADAYTIWNGIVIVNDADDTQPCIVFWPIS